MMLEGLVAWVLNNYLGKYVENLNTDQLSVALLSGKVELENLPLKKDALRHLGLPVEVKSGFIGKVQLQVPVRQIRSAPWIIAIEKLYVVITPINLDEWDSETEALIAHERKVALLDALEAQWRADHEASDAGYYATSYSSWLSYGTGLLANIVENLQLKLNDLHIRYEDALTCAPRAFACGVTVEALTAESCDANWRRGFTLLPHTDACSFKLLELQNLAVYWDPVQAPSGMYANCNVADLTELMRETWKAPHRYLVSPAGGRARVRRERSEQPLRSRARPRLACHLALDAVTLHLASWQYECMVGCLLGLERAARVREFRALRPAAPVRGHARLWWLYALSCHIPEHPWTEPKPTWESCVSEARLARQYVATCLGLAANPAAALPADVKRAKDDFEWRHPLHTLRPLREIALRKVPKSTPASTPDKPGGSGRSMLVHWFPQWWGWYSASADAPSPSPAPAPAPAPAPNPAPNPATAPSPELEEEILDVLADSIENNTLLKRDTVFGKFEFELLKGSLNLCTENEDEVDIKRGVENGGEGPGVELQFWSVRVSVESRPRAAAHSAHLSLGSVVLRERLTPDTLFPVLAAPQGMIREGLSSLSAARARARCQAPQPPPAAQEPLFQLTYEKKPFGINADYRLWVKSMSLEVVYCAAAAAWARRFALAPWRAGRRPPWAAGRRPPARRTRATLSRHWAHMMRAGTGERKSWHVELDISAPQILFVESLVERDACVLVLDFGRLRLSNAAASVPAPAPAAASDLDDEEMFMTPCSTPPGSLLSPASPPGAAAPHPLDAANLHHSLYDRYKIELSDLQILVGRARDNWKYAHTKSTSSLHLLDRFSISLQAERRVVATSDPQYPTAAVRGSLPALVVHLSEHKLAAVRAVVSARLPDTQSVPSPVSDDPVSECSEDNSRSEAEPGAAALFVLQFAIEQMSLEVQSLGRSIAEVQVCGVRCAVAARPADATLALSVHSLLLVDALQTSGPDFELLVASHKHLGMDTASGSILGSEPTSPTSPTSPASPVSRDAPPSPHPRALHRALDSLHRATSPNAYSELDRTSPAPNFLSGSDWNTEPMFTSGASWNSAGAWSASSGGAGGAGGQAWGAGGQAWGAGGQAWGAGGPGWAAPGILDSEALIAVELSFVKGEGDSEDLRIANILFNNLDIIANQETIVELIGFAQRVSAPAPSKRADPPPPAADSHSVDGAGNVDADVSDDIPKRSVRTEITFDFHRLGVLLLRAGVLRGAVVARKIATATLAEARIQATLDASSVEVGGSLGGVQVVSVCEDAGVHTRVLSAGHAAPPHYAHQPHHAHNPHQHQHDDEKALFFTITRKVIAADDDAAPVVEAVVSVHVASVWYSHSGPLLRELRSCLTEFKRCLANLARSIRAAAADMAIGLVHPRGETLYSNPRISASTEAPPSRRRTASLGCSLDDPPDCRQHILLSVSVELESPVVVVPRAAHSTQVLVLHLGRMSLGNRPAPPRQATYRVRVRDISVATLDVGDKVRSQLLATESMERIYDVSAGRPVLHNTALHLALRYTEPEAVQCKVSGEIVGGLHVTARREQYEQVLETVRWVTGDQRPHDAGDAAAARPSDQNGGLLEPAVPTLRLDPALRAAALAAPPPPPPPPPPAAMHLTVEFEVSELSVELVADLGAGARSLVELAFHEFALLYRATHPHETMLQVSLHSITMEDLTKEPGSKHRLLMVSHRAQGPRKAVFLSRSCPDLSAPPPPPAAPRPDLPTDPLCRPLSGSLPAYLDLLDHSYAGLPRARLNLRNTKRESACGVTPPCSPECAPDAREAREGRDVRGASEGQGETQEGGGGAPERPPDDNLVWVSVHTRDPRHPLFEEKYNKVTKLTKVEFNCLNLVVSVDSWVAVLDFFGVAGDDLPEDEPDQKAQQTASSVSSALEAGATETEISVVSLSVVLVRGAGEWCRALVSRARVAGRAGGGARALRGRLGALRLTDLTPGHALWRDRFRTHADNALSFHYTRLNPSEVQEAGYETSLSVEVGPATYVHTRRFVNEMQAFASDFSMLRRVILQARRKVSTSGGGAGRASLRRLQVRCEAPVIVVPVSPRARAALALELTRLTLDNCFRKAGDPDTVSTMTRPHNGEPEILEVRNVRLEGASLWCASAGAEPGAGSKRGHRLARRGPALVHAPAHLTFIVEQNLTQTTHSVADMTVHGTLTTLQLALEPAQYRVLRGVLAHNLAAAPPAAPPPPPAPHLRQVWTTSSLKLELLDVKVRLEPVRDVSSLACVNFIKSRLLLETYSDLGQDVDLVSQEILVSDTRYSGEPANRRGNVFSHILQPMPEQRHSVQAELHARKRGDSSAYTILVNNMRLMGILDWWEAVNQFLTQPPAPAADPDLAHLEETQQEHNPATQAAGAGLPAGAGAGAGAGQVELKLNVTDSQLVFVEDASVWDTNAVILRSTTVIQYRACDPHKPVSCELSELEVFSCVLGLEEETALSIVDPASVTVALLASRVLHVTMGTLNLRLSYHDMRMFAAMLRSLPAQARAALSAKLLLTSSSEEDAPANSVHMYAADAAPAAPAPPPPAPPHPAAKPAWGYAARWGRAAASEAVQPPQAESPIWPLKAVQVNADCITLCVIDDCLDSDVPLLELSLAELDVHQDLRKPEEGLEDPLLVMTPAGPPPPPPGIQAGAGMGAGAGESGSVAGGGRLSALLSADYYNRTLSGWEPVIEPWKFQTQWESSAGSAVSAARAQVAAASPDTLHANLTPPLLELARLVRRTWADDYYRQSASGSSESPKGSPAGHRRRSPFVPYALRNHTGHRLWFTTLLTTAHELRESNQWSGPDDSWVCVRAGDTEPFSFGGRRARARLLGGGAAGVGGGGAAAQDAHAATLHQLALRLDGWSPPDPVCVDRVGVYFRNITHTKTGVSARIVLEVSLEGSARKLVRVRSALQLRNRLPHAVEVRVDHAPAPATAQWSGSGVRVAQVGAGESWAAPLSASPGALWTRPLPRGPPAAAPATAAPTAALAPAAIDWRDATTQRALLHYECRAPPDYVYRFCCSIIRERFPPDRGQPTAGHTLTLVPALRLENLLPVELHYRCGPAPATPAAPAPGDALPPGETRPFHEVNVEEGVELSVKLEGFGWSSALSVGGGAGPGAFTARLKLRDSRGRRLYLTARLRHTDTDGIQVSVSAAYWLVNRTGLPLVFRAEGGAGEAAGQGAEHELARVVAPLAFSFADADAGPTLAVRLGLGRAANPDWCSPFGLGPGVTVKRLTCRGGGAGPEISTGAAGVGGAGGGSEGEEREYTIGVSVRAGRGRYRRTNIVTFTPRYQLHNDTSYRLQFAQKCTATTLSDPGAMATHVCALPGCYLPWHWPRADRERLMCARVLAAGGPPGTQPTPLSAWSGGFRADRPRSLHLACRETGGGGGYIMIRVEVVSQEASLLVVLTDGESAPPPVRIDNHSPVSIMFHQVGCPEESVVGAHSRVEWALPEPEGASAIALRPPGGTRATVLLDALDPPNHAYRLLYQNFIYVAFTNNNPRESIGKPGTTATPDDEDVLVLEVPLGSTKVILGKKRYGDRSQLWRRGPNEQLIHEGSSPPQPTDALLADDQTISPHAMVLDIEEAAPRPGVASCLVVRRADVRRASTQAWRVTRRRMTCAHANLCVRPAPPAGLVPGNRVVLALPAAAGARGAGAQGVCWQRLRPGSGRLRVTLRACGPTRLLSIHEPHHTESDWIDEGDSDDESRSRPDSTSSGRRAGGREWAVRVSLGGLGVSLVDKAPPAELVHAVFSGLTLELAAADTLAIALSVKHMQWDNQLLGTPSPVLLYCLPERGAGAGAGAGAVPALHAALEVSRAPRRRYNAVYFQHLVVALRPLAVRLEERLLLQVWAWARAAGGFTTEEEDAAAAGAGPGAGGEEAERDARQLPARADLAATRYYFALIKIMPSQIRLSMMTAPKLEPSLSLLKRRLGLTLIKFEDAAVELEPFVRAHMFDTAPHLAAHLLAHFKDELKWQAAKILGSVDFLGNPLGFVADVSEGVSGLILEGNVAALLKNVTHGISNSAAKVTESLGDGLERVVSDEAHEETRRRIRSTAAGAHLAAGFRGLGLGILGGMTSLVKHSYEGAAAEGLPGFLAGVGKGLVGTVTKPVIGVLDLAAETASALRDTSRRSDRWVPGRMRAPRRCAGAGGLLPRYCAAEAAGAALLHALNRHDYAERFLAYRAVRDRPHDIRALLSDTYLRIFTCKHQEPQVVMETHLSNLVSCSTVTIDNAHYVELGVRGGGAGAGGGGAGAGEAVRRPRVQCDSAELAAWVARHAAYARQLYYEQMHTLHPHPDLGDN